MFADFTASSSHINPFTWSSKASYSWSSLFSANYWQSFEPVARVRPYSDCYLEQVYCCWPCTCLTISLGYVFGSSWNYWVDFGSCFGALECPWRRMTVRVSRIRPYCWSWKAQNCLIARSARPKSLDLDHFQGYIPSVSGIACACRTNYCASFCFGPCSWCPTMKAREECLGQSSFWWPLAATPPSSSQQPPWMASSPNFEDRHPRSPSWYRLFWTLREKFSCLGWSFVLGFLWTSRRIGCWRYRRLWAAILRVLEARLYFAPCRLLGFPRGHFSHY